jgi:hypothetical protein
MSSPEWIVEISLAHTTAGQDSFLVEGGGFEPPKASPTDLQSVPFDRSGTPPYHHAQSTIQQSIDQEGRLITWSWRWDLNPQPADYKSAALPIELRQRKSVIYKSLPGQKSTFFLQVQKGH